MLPVEAPRPSGMNFAAAGAVGALLGAAACLGRGTLALSLTGLGVGFCLGLGALVGAVSAACVLTLAGPPLWRPQRRRAVVGIAALSGALAGGFALDAMFAAVITAPPQVMEALFRK